MAMAMAMLQQQQASVVVNVVRQDFCTHIYVTKFRFEEFTQRGGFFNVTRTSGDTLEV